MKTYRRFPHGIQQPYDRRGGHLVLDPNDQSQYFSSTNGFKRNAYNQQTDELNWFQYVSQPLNSHNRRGYCEWQTNEEATRGLERLLLLLFGCLFVFKSTDGAKLAVPRLRSRGVEGTEMLFPKHDRFDLCLIVVVSTVDCIFKRLYLPDFKYVQDLLVSNAYSWNGIYLEASTSPMRACRNAGFEYVYLNTNNLLRTAKFTLNHSTFLV